jgi:glycogen synthase
MGRLPGYMQFASGLDAIVITPFHHKIEKEKVPEKRVEGKTSEAGRFTVSFDGRDVPITLLRYEDKWPWYFIRPEDDLFFAGTPNPYLVGSTQKEIAENLLRDSLLFGSCVAQSLKIIDPSVNWILMMQDWEAATTALALANQQSHYKMFLTLHNSYDSRATDADLRRVNIDAKYCPAYWSKPDVNPYEKTETVLARTLQIIQTPVFTVSEQFALDLTNDQLQTEVMAHHLQGLLKDKLLGVNNGPFVDLALDREIIDKARQGNFEALKQWKSDNRKKALEALNSFAPSDKKPIWGKIKEFDPADESVCWFVMAGRDDTRQKGYDVAVAAVEEFLNKGGDARFFFFPVPGDEGLLGLSFLEELAKQFPQKVLAFPFIWVEGFMATLQGASYGIMPSLYEPFGMANEFYLKGTVGIGRATGGILQQIVPLWADASFSYAAEVRALRWHSESSHATGILFRERDRIESARVDWSEINAAGYNIPGGATNKPNRVKQRKGFALFESMAYELSLAITDGVRIYKERPNLYFRMLIEGIDFIRNTFSWERSAQEYYRNIR